MDASSSRSERLPDSATTTQAELGQYRTVPDLLWTHYAVVYRAGWRRCDRVVPAICRALAKALGRGLEASRRAVLRSDPQAEHTKTCSLRAR